MKHDWRTKIFLIILTAYTGEKRPSVQIELEQENTVLAVQREKKAFLWKIKGENTFNSLIVLLFSLQFALLLTCFYFYFKSIVLTSHQKGTFQNLLLRSHGKIAIN